MISPIMVQEVRRLLAAGELSQRKIARQTGISRATISLIAQGRRPDYAPKPRAWDDDWATTVGPPRRCGHCGGLVHMPCRLCRVRAIKQRDLERAKARRFDALHAANEATSGEQRPNRAPTLAWPGRDGPAPRAGCASRTVPELRTPAPTAAARLFRPDDAWSRVADRV